jgi:acetyl esterase/lipase
MKTAMIKLAQKAKVFFILAGFFFLQPVVGQEVIRLYKGKAPGSETWDWSEKATTKNPINTTIVYNVSEPTLTVFRPAPGGANGSAVIIVPGGGLHVLLFEKEGVTTAKALAKKGIMAFVLKYRLQRSTTDDPWQEMMERLNDTTGRTKGPSPISLLARADLTNAVRYIRKQAATYNVDSSRVGLVGFSAGAVISLNTIYHAELDAVPDFAAINYGVFPSGNRALLRDKVTPLFIAAAADDSLALAHHSLQIFNEWYAAKRPVELHIYATGGHGLTSHPASAWVDRFADWLEKMGFFKTQPKR